MNTRRKFLQGLTQAGLLLACGRRIESAAGKASPQTAQRQKSSRKVQTVLGPIDAAGLGFTLPHEHVCVTSAGFWQVWPEYFGGRAQFISKTIGKLKRVKQAGIGTIVDVTPADVGRDIRLLEAVSRGSGVNIIACTGHWLHPSLSMGARTVEELTGFFVAEIDKGIEGTGIRAGVIKVATDREGVTPFIEKALRAAARASKATGIPVTTHTYAAGRTAERQADIFESEGLSPSSVCLGHCDDTDDLTYLTGLLERGYTIGMDHLPWGARASEGTNPPILSWQRRVECAKKLIDAGYQHRLFLSNDWYFGLSIGPTGTMESMETMNPDGMLFTVRKTIPYLKQLGVTDEAIRTITVENPRRFFGGELPAR